ncbi:hypothetical protein LEP1GSC168_1755 [Leptospira santarosai str. HAI134]|nr:hypothetical protein LEP1GSC168_1755 [Leptospira santarosai str. HAI134]
MLFASHFIIKSFYRKLYSIHSNRMNRCSRFFLKVKIILFITNYHIDKKPNLQMNRKM